MKSYQEYKDSGVDWIGRVPLDWKVSQLKFNCNIQGRVGYKGYTVGDLVSAGEGPLTLGAKHISKKNKLDLSSPEYISWEKYYESPEIMVYNGDILLTQRGTLGKVALIEGNIGEATINPSMVLLNKLTCSAKYLYYFFNSDYFSKWVDLTNTATAVPMISQEQLGNFKILIPAIDEQIKIGHYLDGKTTQIDKLINDKEKLIELLNEEHASVINDAITKGVNSNASMADSNIDWLGQIPKHWDVKKIKYVAYLKSGDNITSDFITTEGDYPVYGGNGLRGYYEKYNMDGDYVLIGRQGALCGNINYASNKFWASEHAIVCHLNKDNDWIWFGNLLMIMNLNQYSQSAAQPGLAVEKIKNLSIPVPNYEEQVKIGELIISECERINKVSQKIQKEIEHLKEYKTALISEVVTGKVDVRDKIIAQSLSMV